MTDTTLPPAKWVAYTPAKAAKLLAANTANRRLRQPVVDRYRADMLAGHWKANGDTIKVADDGTLIDGQHRLEAIAQAGDQLPGPITILTVSELVMDQVMAVTDTGLKRMPADALHLAGYRNSTALSAMARGVIRLQTGRLFKGGGNRAIVSNSEMMEWMKKHPNSEDLLSENLWVIRKTNMPPGSGMTAFWFLYDIDAFRAVEFMQSLATLEGLKKGSPIAALARAVNRIRIDRTMVRDFQWLAMIFQTWNAWLADEEWDRPLTHQQSLNRDRFPWPMSRDEALRKAEAAALDNEREQDALPEAG